MANTCTSINFSGKKNQIPPRKSEYCATQLRAYRLWRGSTERQHPVLSMARRETKHSRRDLMSVAHSLNGWNRGRARVVQLITKQETCDSVRRLAVAVPVIPSTQFIRVSDWPRANGKPDEDASRGYSTGRAVTNSSFLA
jgi:hypothetical protein